MIVQALTKLGLAETGNLSSKVDPLSLLLKRSVAVYIEVDQSRYLVRAKASAMALFVSNCTILKGEETDHTLGLSIAQDLLYLRLDDSQVAEIRDFGDCHITLFSRGGLVRRQIAKEHGGAIRGESGDVNALELVNLDECSLIDKKKWDARRPSIEVGRELMSSDPFVVGRRVGKNDLFLSVVDAQMLRLGGSSNRDCVEYPFNRGAYPPDDGRVRPLPIIWLYEVSVAFNSGLIRPCVVDEQRKKTQGYLEIAKWLEDNAPESVVKGALKKTARTIASKDYNRSKNFDEQGLARFPDSEHVPVENLSLPVRFALAITEWWVGLPKERQSRPQLLCELIAVGFDKTAALDFVGMISGKPVPRDERDGLWELAQKTLRGRKLRKLGERKVRKILRKSSPSDQPERAATDGVDE